MFTVVGLFSGLVVGLIGDNPGTMLVTTVLASLVATLVNIVVYRFWLLFPPADDPSPPTRQPPTEPPA